MELILIKVTARNQHSTLISLGELTFECNID